MDEFLLKVFSLMNSIKPTDFLYFTVNQFQVFSFSILFSQDYFSQDQVFFPCEFYNKDLIPQSDFIVSDFTEYGFCHCEFHLY